MTTVLIVDDEVAIIEALAGILEDEGYSVLTATDGRLALEVLARAPVEVVIMDVMMPVMSGRELLVTLRAQPRWANVPVLVMSAVPLHALQRSGTPPLAGHQAFLQKPFELEELLRVLATLAQRAPLAAGPMTKSG